MHPLDRIRQLASYALAALLLVNAAFCFAMTALATVRSMADAAGYDWGVTAIFAMLTLVFAVAARFFWWFGRGAGR